MESAQNKPETLKLAGKCRDCKREFWEKEDAGVHRYRASKGGMLCKDDRRCRARQIRQLPGYEPYGTIPAGVLLYLMDRRPAELPPKARFHAIFDTDTRVLAALLYYSTTWPISMPYACELDPASGPKDANVRLDAGHQPMVMTRESLARHLGIAPSHVSESCGRWAARKVIRIARVPGRESVTGIYVAEAPAITALERAGVLRMIEGDPASGNRRAVPASVAKRLERVLAAMAADEETRGGYWTRCMAVRAVFLGKLSEARAQEKSAYGGLLAEAASHLPPGVSVPRLAPAAIAAPPRPASPDAARQERLFEIVAGWQRQYPDTPFGADVRDPANKRHQAYIRHLDSSLAGSSIVDWREFVEDRFAGEDALNSLAKRPSPRPRSPRDPGGPESVGVLIDMAEEYARKAVRYGEAFAERRRNSDMHAEAERRGLAAREREHEREAEESARAEKAWAELPERDRQARIRTADKALKSDQRYRNMSTQQRSAAAEQLARRTLRQELSGRGATA